MNKDYKILILTNGDKLIGELVLKSESTLTLYRPFQLKVLTLMDEIEDMPESMIRQEVLVLKNWLDMSKSQKAEIERIHILSLTEPTDKVCKFYDAEKEKEDNPGLLEDMLEKLQEDTEFDPYENQQISGDEAMFLNNEDIQSILDKMANGNIKKYDTESDDTEDIKNESKDPNEFDTDKDMFGW